MTAWLVFMGGFICGASLAALGLHRAIVRERAVTREILGLYYAELGRRTDRSTVRARRHAEWN